MFPYINLLHDILKDQDPFPLIRMPLVLHLQCSGQAGENLFKTLHQEILKVVFGAETRPRPDTDRRWHGHRVFAVDGSSLNLPRGLVHEGWRTPVDGAHYP